MAFGLSMTTMLHAATPTRSGVPRVLQSPLYRGSWDWLGNLSGTSMYRAGTFMSAGASLLGGFAGAQDAKAQAALADYNARVYEQEARAIERRTLFEQLMAMRAGNRQLGSVIAKAGASGADISEGAPLYAIAEQAYQNELQTALVGYSGQVEASRLRSQAEGYRLAGRVGRMQAKTSLLTGFLGGVSDLAAGQALAQKQGFSLWG